MALVTNNISGSASNSSKIGITGSVIIGNAPDGRFPTAGTDTVFFVSGSDASRSVFGGTAVVSGSLITDGNVQIGDSSNDTLTINASTVSIPNNLNFDSNTLYIDSTNNRIGIGKVPGVTLDVSGSLSSTGSDQPSTIFNGDTFISGAFGVSDYIQMKPVGSLRIPTNQSASYIYTSGSTNDLYFTQYAPGTSFTNTTRLRWLEGHLHTGLLHGGILSTQAGTTTFTITSGSGLIVTYNASTTSDPYPTIQYVTWPTYLSQSLTYVASNQISYIGINPSAGIIQRTTPFNNGDYLDYISIGRILHQSGSVTNAAVTNPTVAYGATQQHNHFTRAFGPLKISGHTLAVSGSTLGLTKTSGDAYAEGRNYRTEPDDPNYTRAATDTDVTVSKVYRQYSSGSSYRIDTGIANAGYTVIDPTLYNPDGLGTLSSVSAGQHSIQRVYWFPNSVDRAFYVYYGNATYNSLDAAEAAIVTETFTESENTRTSAILAGYLLVKGNASDLSNTSQARFVQAGLFRGGALGGGSGGAGSTTPGGLDTYVQFNDGGSTFGGNSNLTFTKATNTLAVPNISVTALTASLTQGSVLFSGPSGVVTQDNTNLFWDDTNNYLGIGTTSPARPLHVSAAGGWRVSLTTSSTGFEFINLNSTTWRLNPVGTATDLEIFSNVTIPTNGTAGLGFNPSAGTTKDTLLYRSAIGVISLSGSAPGFLFNWLSTSTPTTVGDLGMNTSSGRPQAFISGTVRQLSHIDELVAGSTGQIQYNNGGSPGASSTLTFNSANNILASLNVSATSITASNLTVTSNGSISGNATVAGSTTTNTLFVNTGNVVGSPGAGANVLSLLSSGNIVMKLDVNNDSPGHKFDVQDYLGISQFFVGENGNAELSGSLVTTGSLTVSGSATLGIVSEVLSGSNAIGGTFVFDTTRQSIFYVNNATSNITANFTNVPTVDNRIISTTVILSQSATARIVTAVQIAGVASTINWANNVTPTGNSGKQDIFGFNLIRSGSAWKTLGQMTTYG